MKKITAKILLLVLIFNTIFSNLTINIFGAEISGAKSANGFTWNKASTLNNEFQTEERKSSSDEIYLTWNIEKDKDYTLLYPIEDGKEGTFTVKQIENKYDVEFKINNINKVDKKNNLTIYKNGSFVDANKTNFPDNGDIQLTSTFQGNGGANKVQFKITEGKGVVFKYQGITIKTILKEGKINFVTNKMKQGNIYPFKLQKGNGTPPANTEIKRIFLGIDTSQGNFIVKPFANACDKAAPVPPTCTAEEGKEIIDQTLKRPIEEYPGEDIVGVKITFNSPKEWKNTPEKPLKEADLTGDGVKNSFQFLSEDEQKQKATEVIFDLNHKDSQKGLQIKIKDIYKTTNENGNVTITSNAASNIKVTPTYTYNKETGQGTLILKGLESSTIYSGGISAERQNEPFETIASSLELGKIYTYPKFRVVGFGTNEFYLEIEPFKGYNGFYVVRKGSQSSTLQRWVTYEEKLEGKNNILVTVPFDATAPAERYFDVNFSFTPPGLDGELPFTSQKIKYKPFDQDIVLSTPKNLQVVKSNIIRKEDSSEELFLTLKWDIDRENVLELLLKQNQDKELAINYLFFKGTRPDEYDDKPFMNIVAKVSKAPNVEKDKDDKPKVEVKYELGSKDISKDDTKIELVQTQTRTTHRVEVLAGKPHKILEANVTVKMPIAKKDTPNRHTIFDYPNTYFLSTQAKYTISPSGGAAQNLETGKSTHATLILNGIADIPVPIPQKLKLIKDSVTDSSFAVDYQTLKYKVSGDLLYDYNEIMLKTLDRCLKDESIKYDFYITRERKLADELTKSKKGNKLPETVSGLITEYKFDDKTMPQPPQPEVLAGGESSGSSGENGEEETKPQENAVLTIDFTKPELKSAIDAIRNGKIVKIADIPQNIKFPIQELIFKGLDENDTYYLLGVTTVLPYGKETDKPSLLAKQDEEAAPPEPAPEPVPPAPPAEEDNCKNPLPSKKDYSSFSQIVTVTTKSDANSPTDDEKIPAAPLKFEAKDVTLNSVNLIWTRVKEEAKENLKEEEKPEQPPKPETPAKPEEKPDKPDGSKPEEKPENKSRIEYQFLRTKGEQLPVEFLKTRDSFEKTWITLDKVKDKAGFRTHVDKIYEFSKESKAFSTTPAKKDRFEYVSPTGDEGNILDITLQPNQIYFYYLRAVRVSSDGKDTAYSTWVPLTVTTKNAPGPRNLRVEPTVKYDKKTEVALSFDIPKMDKEILDREYEFYYSMREDAKDWGKDIIIEKSKMTIAENSDGKTLKVTFKISGLKPGKLYTFRVKMVNKPLNAFSSYSNELEHRTDTDGSDIEYDDAVNNWELNFAQLIEKLKNESYWFAKNDTSNTVVYYRPQYFDKILGSSNNSIVELVAGNGSSKEYYLPASAVVKAFDANKGFKVTYGGSEVIISPKTLNPNENEVIKKLSEEVKSKKIDTKDYFVKVGLNFRNNKYNVNGNDSVGPLVTISFTGVSIKEDMETFDYEMVKYLEELLETKEFKEDLKKEIGKLITDKTENVEMVKKIQAIADRFIKKFSDRLNHKLNNVKIKDYTINVVNGDIIITINAIKDVSISGYKVANNTYTPVDTRDYSGKRAMYVRQTGDYVFAGKKIVIPGVANLPNGDKMTSVIIKYELDDFFGKNGINLKAPTTRRAVVGSLARMAGASKTQDPVEFFKSKGVVLSNRNLDGNSTSEEAVYLVMKVYEMKTKTKLDTVKVRNYNFINNIKNVNKNYKKPIQVAFETGIYKNQNMNAKGTISTQEFLDTITNMASKVGM